MPNWVRLIAANECVVGRGRFVEAAGHELAVFRLEHPPQVVVIRNSCPHAGGNLAAGAVNGTCVTCPWHHWEFDLVSGVCTLSDSARLTRFESRERDGFIEALLPESGEGRHNVTDMAE